MARPRGDARGGGGRPGTEQPMSDLSSDPPVQVDFLEAGSSAVNLFGYGKTPPWPNEVRQSLDDQARLVEARCRPAPTKFTWSAIRSAARSP